MTDENNRVKTAVDLAVLNSKLDTVISGINEIRESAERRGEKLANHEERIIRIEERQTTQARLQATLTAIGTVAAGWWGARS